MPSEFMQRIDLTTAKSQACTPVDGGVGCPSQKQIDELERQVQSPAEKRMDVTPRDSFSQVFCWVPTLFGHQALSSRPLNRIAVGPNEYGIEAMQAKFEGEPALWLTPADEHNLRAAA
jgi:hypothetical protein